jgi:hypothetical protein
VSEVGARNKRGVLVATALGLRAWSTGHQSVDLGPCGTDGYVEVESQPPAPDWRRKGVAGREYRQIDIRLDVGVELNRQRRPRKTRQRAWLSWNRSEGYTYFNAATGIEFSAVSGLTYNFTNPQTDYKNGIDWHVDLEASRFLTKQFYVGAVGYSFNQLTGDTGSGATLGSYISRISAVGPEIGVLFPVAGMQGSLNLRGYWEFAAQNRSSGWNTWLVFSIVPAASTEKTPMVVK